MNDFEEKQLVKIASLYYEDGFTQAQIAKQVGVSRSLISKLLNDAKEQGIVEITINSKNAYTSYLERKLEKELGIKTAMVIDTQDLTCDEIERKTAKYAADYLKNQLKEIKSIGISWGKGIRRLVDAVSYASFNEVAVIPLIGGMGDSYVNIHSNQLSYDLARKIRGDSKYLYTPALVSDPQLAVALRGNQTVKSVLDCGQNVDFAVVGLGVPYSKSTMEEIGYLTKKDLAELKQSDVIGDINSTFFNSNGEEVNNDLNHRIVGVGLDAIKKIPNVMTIVTDEQRIKITRTALQNQLVNILVTTEKIAELLLSDRSD